ncbi:MAG: cell division protein FtsQ/DivIB [Alphaproteobacteria bacterium]
MGQLNPGDIIRRAAATVPSDAPQKPARAQAAPRQHRRSSEEESARPNETARRHPAARPRVRRSKWRIARNVIWLLVLVGLPGWTYATNRHEPILTYARVQIAKWTNGGIDKIGLVVTEVLVEGRERTAREHIAAKLGIRYGQSILDVDLYDVKQRMEQLPWVRKASVERHLPNRIYISITERDPIARYHTKDGVALISSVGEVVKAPDTDKYAKLILLAGDDAPAQAAALLELIAKEPAMARRVVGAERVGKRRWDVRFDNGLALKLPDHGVTVAWSRFATLDKEHKLLDRGAVVIDMRLNDRMVIQLPSGVTAKDLRLAAQRGE